MMVMVRRICGQAQSLMLKIKALDKHCFTMCLNPCGSFKESGCGVLVSGDCPHPSTYKAQPSLGSLQEAMRLAGPK
jgi:hypothetical protein